MNIKKLFEEETKNMEPCNDDFWHKLDFEFDSENLKGWINSDTGKPVSFEEASEYRNVKIYDEIIPAMLNEAMYNGFKAGFNCAMELFTQK